MGVLRRRAFPQVIQIGLCWRLPGQLNEFFADRRQTVLSEFRSQGDIRLRNPSRLAGESASSTEQPRSIRPWAAP